MDRIACRPTAVAVLAFVAVLSACSAPQAREAAARAEEIEEEAEESDGPEPDVRTLIPPGSHTLESELGRTRFLPLGAPSVREDAELQRSGEELRRR
jgi:hypothetical protein